MESLFFKQLLIIDIMHRKKIKKGYKHFLFIFFIVTKIHLKLKLEHSNHYPLGLGCMVQQPF